MRKQQHGESSGMPKSGIHEKSCILLCPVSTGCADGTLPYNATCDLEHECGVCEGVCTKCEQPLTEYGLAGPATFAEPCGHAQDFGWGD